MLVRLRERLDIVLSIFGLLMGAFALDTRTY